MKFRDLLLAGILLVAGCATNPEKVRATFVSPAQYANYDCIQIREEMIRVFSRANTMTSMQRSKSDKDALAVGASIALFWPAAFLVAGGDVKDELASLKGQYAALTEASNAKNCPLSPELPR
jgi:hypothetical protein